MSNLFTVVSNENGYKAFNQDLYDKFVFKIMEGNLCEALKQYPQYLDPSFELNYEICLKTQKNILTKGF